MNDFSQDPTCKALWRFEPGALIHDSIGANHLTEVQAGASDPVNCWEGSGSLGQGAGNALYKIADADLGAGFPFKSDGPNVGTFGLYYRRTSDLPTTFLAKWSKYCFNITETAGFFAILIGLDDTNSEECVLTLGSSEPLQMAVPYYLCIRFDGENKIIDIRCRNINTGDRTFFTFAFIHTLNISDGDFEVALTSGNLDELVIFDRLISEEEEDQIVAQTFGAPPPYPYTPGLPLLSASRHPMIKAGTALTATGDQVGQAVYWELVAYDAATGREGAPLGSLMFDKTITDGAKHCKNYYFAPSNPALAGKVDRVKARIAHA
jgi:hypothetical protein